MRPLQFLRKSNRIAAATERRVNLGCGLNAVEGWLNLDRSPNLVLDRAYLLKVLLRRMGLLSDGHMARWPRNVVLHDVRRGLPLQDGAAEAIYSSHMLEHLHFEDASKVLNECVRVLQPGGIIRLALPDALEVARRLVEGDGSERASRRFNDDLNAYPNRRPGWTGFLTSSPGHRWQPTASLVAAMLRQAGFVEVREWVFQKGELPDLEKVEHRLESIFLEGRRP